MVSNTNLLFQGSIFRGELLVSGRVQDIWKWLILGCLPAMVPVNTKKHHNIVQCPIRKGSLLIFMWPFFCWVGEHQIYCSCNNPSTNFMWFDCKDVWVCTPTLQNKYLKPKTVQLIHACTWCFVLSDMRNFKEIKVLEKTANGMQHHKVYHNLP